MTSTSDRKVSDGCGPEGQDAEQADHQRNPLEFGEIRGFELGHPDVVVEHVDLGQIVAVVSAHEVVGIDVEIQALRVLLRDEGHVPQRNEESRNQDQSGGQNRQSCCEPARGRSSEAVSRWRNPDMCTSEMGPGGRVGAPGPWIVLFHEEVALHLLVQRATEVRAVEGEDSGLSAVKVTVLVSPGSITRLMS